MSLFQSELEKKSNNRQQPSGNIIYLYTQQKDDQDDRDARKRLYSPR